MNRSFRTWLLAALALPATLALAQTPPYPVTISGTVAGCSPTSSVNITTVQNTQPAFNVNVPVDPATCTYTYTHDMISEQGWFMVSTMCLGANQSQSASFGVDSTFVVSNFNCGGTDPCEACMQVEQVAPFTGLFTSCSSGGLEPYELLWDFSEGGAVPGDSVTMEFPGPGAYFACLNFSTADGCSQFACEQIYVDDDGNISLVPPTVCQACISFTPVMNGNDPVPFQANFIDCSTGAPTLDYLWWLPNGLNSDEQNQTFTFPGPGTYSVCLDITDGMGCESTLCDSVVVDPNGGINTTPSWYDCEGVQWGPSTAGTPCQQNGMAGVWDANCDCVPNTTSCQACILPVQSQSGGQLLPYVVDYTSCSTGSGNLTYLWTTPSGNTLTDPGFFWQFDPGPGPHVVCLAISDDLGCTSITCDTLMFDTLGYITTDPVWYDCLGILNGPNMPGTPCTDPATGAGTWSANCACVPTACHACIITAQDSTPGNGLTPFTAQYTSCSTGEAPLTYLWDFGNGSTSDLPNPLYQYDAPGIYLTCLTITDNLGCTSFTCDTLVIDTNGIIDPFPTPDCEAGFWTIQAYDSTGGGVAPIPNEVWVWNLSSGGNGNFQFLWSFGDGTSSTDAFPTHTYSGPGPWLLCLTMYSDNCTDTYCDSVSVDENGILNGLMPDGHGTFVHERSDGFTLNVIQQLPTGIAETAAIADLKTWPNPVDELLHISFLNRMAGEVDLTVTDPLGRTVLSRQLHLGSGSNLLQVPTDHLEPGLYLVRIGQGPQGITQRFMKVR